MRNLQRNQRVEAYATANASGTATPVVEVKQGPSWEVKQISISVTGSTTLPKCDTYLGRNSAGVFISHSETGDADTDSSPNITARSGDSLCAVFTQVTPGIECKMTVVYDEVGY